MAADPMNEALLERHLTCKDELVGLIEQEEKEHRQCSRIECLTPRDTNTMFFMRKTREIKMCNTLLGNNDLNKSSVTTRAKLVSIATSHFLELFRSSKIVTKSKKIWFPHGVT